MDIRLDALPSDPAALQAIIRAQASALRSRDTLIDRLRAQLAALKRARFGASSEKLERAIEQLELMLEDGEATLAEAAPTGSPAEPAATPDRPARQAPPPHLPREEVRHEPAPVCPDCGGGKLRKRGEDVTEVLEYVPASFRVIRHVRPRYACCDCDAPVQAPTPGLPIERGKPGPGLVAHVLCAKYCDHLPLYRQSDIYAREGVEIARSTMADWVGRASALMAPLIEALRAHVFAGDRLHGDDTPVPVLDPGRGRTRQGRLWVYVRDGRPAGDAKTPPAACYLYSPDRKGAHPAGASEGLRRRAARRRLRRLQRHLSRPRSGRRRTGARGRLLGPCPPQVLRPRRRRPGADRRRGAQAHRRALRRRGSHPRRPARRTSPRPRQPRPLPRSMR